jgi:hypothetical protein
VSESERTEQSTLLGDGMGRRWEPDVGDARAGDVLNLAHQRVVPSSVLLPRLPIEALITERDKLKLNSVQVMIRTDATVQREQDVT